MTESQSFDDVVDRAWSTHQDRLADVIAVMREDDLLAIELGEESSVDGFVPCVQFLAWGDGQIRCEVPSNAYLDPHYRLTAADEARLVDLGWQRPTRAPDDEPDSGSPAFFVDKPANWADQLAAMSVTVFREVWSVPHPTFLRIDAPEATEWVEALEPEDDDSYALDLVRAVTPRDSAHLYDLVASTLSELFDEPAGDDDPDEDDDFMVAIGPLVGFVGPHLDGGEVQVRMPLVRDVSDRTRASELLADLNRRWPHLKFTLTADRVDVWAAVLATPYVPQHLIDTLQQLFAFARTVDPRFATRFGGRLDALVDDEPDAVEVQRGEMTPPQAPKQPGRQGELFSDPGEQTLFDEPN
ncbi:TY-Chap domain-containing protein [Rhodococcus gannanensis]|uniref:YbjN domain-containing protein n=1 Tax=Rhodococcus gannanensis TaxID=1960308 RepID=A0ABW4P1I4_9NOCA